MIEDSASKSKRSSSGFTIVELLIVIVVIGILAAITMVAYNGVQTKARTAKIQSDLSALQQAVRLARESTSKTMLDITESGATSYSPNGCTSKTPGTDLSALPTTDACWTSYASALAKISAASGMNVNGLVDPWGRPYFIDENEGERGTSCSLDVIGVFALPTNASAMYPNSRIAIPLSGHSGCSLT